MGNLTLAPFSISVHRRYIKPNESHSTLELTICYFKLGCLCTPHLPSLGSREWSQCLGFARELPQEAQCLPCRLRSINSLFPIHPIAENRWHKSRS